MSPSSTQFAPLTVLLVVLVLVVVTEARYEFATCKSRIEGILNGTVTDDTISKDDLLGKNYLWHHPIRGLDTSVVKNSSFITVTYEGCKALCGADKTGLNASYTAFAIFTTWVLPAVALFSNLPYESLSTLKRKTVEAFTNWIGSPQAALANTMFNVLIIRTCQQRSDKKGEMTQEYRDAFYVLSCVNQYEYASYERNPWNRYWTRQERDNRQKVRDQVLLYGLFRPLSKDTEDRRVHDPDTDISATRVLLYNLAFQLRMLRRRGVYPQFINIIWFLVAFTISLVTAFADLGNNTTAHSLALGLLLSWLPVLVTMMIVDRNPSASTRAGVLIERWLYDVNHVLRSRHAGMQCADGMTYATRWRPGLGQLDLVIGSFVGQGRRLRYCGIANAILEITENVKFHEDDDILKQYHSRVVNLRGILVRRPLSWWTIWLAAEFMVSMAAWMAFMVSFRTPTVGLGCRSLMAMLWWIFSTLPWILQAFLQEPPRWTLWITIPLNTMSVIFLFMVMLFQVTNGLNNCLCKATIFGTSSYGGYIDFENAQFYKSAFHVVRYWACAAAFGLATSILFIGWGLRQWSKSSALWSAAEDAEMVAD
ncbi:hypothetical protein LTR66_008388 [Elasticomyces elasticus]|nr:hypothetical protein LTR66_008388 [Elasticomyces elasticus]